MLKNFILCLSEIFEDFAYGLDLFVGLAECSYDLQIMGCLIAIRIKKED